MELTFSLSLSFYALRGPIHTREGRQANWLTGRGVGKFLDARSGKGDPVKSVVCVRVCVCVCVCVCARARLCEEGTICKLGGRSALEPLSRDCDTVPRTACLRACVRVRGAPLPSSRPSLGARARVCVCAQGARPGVRREEKKKIDKTSGERERLKTTINTRGAGRSRVWHVARPSCCVSRQGEVSKRAREREREGWAAGDPGWSWASSSCSPCSSSPCWASRSVCAD